VFYLVLIPFWSIFVIFLAFGKIKKSNMADIRGSPFWEHDVIPMTCNIIMLPTLKETPSLDILFAFQISLSLLFTNERAQKLFGGL